MGPIESEVLKAARQEIEGQLRDSYVVADEKSLDAIERAGGMQMLIRGGAVGIASLNTFNKVKGKKGEKEKEELTRASVPLLPGRAYNGRLLLVLSGSRKWGTGQMGKCVSTVMIKLAALFSFPSANKQRAVIACNSHAHDDLAAVFSHSSSFSSKVDGRGSNTFVEGVNACAKVAEDVMETLSEGQKATTSINILLLHTFHISFYPLPCLHSSSLPSSSSGSSRVRERGIDVIELPPLSDVLNSPQRKLAPSS
eukprot:CAMPEP_0113898020 /NCGR_PEP_ID=MMETSP0780_2-20120614/19078_1 /TAXON_ID=652834 /ORGANISM="Palpitomonas bilix" /LENGTH=253 /DNA_ID=CAMNT_0000889699 /DNA_START=61 /DNA_END=818 /DNA_ORIENTATION=- /assembly_acc=CAM_ASM_000599